MTLEELLAMPMHEVRVIAKNTRRPETDMQVVRVPGGWIYFLEGLQGKAMWFVPEPKENG